MLDIVMIDNDKKRKLVQSVQYGLKLAKDNIESQELPEKNGLGVFSLNYVFKAARIVCKNSFLIAEFQRGPFKTIFLFDETTKTVISYTSKANLKRLINRRRVSKVHYIDALTLLNADFVEPQQLCFFDDSDSVKNDLQRLKESVIAKLGELKPAQYMTISYEINHRAYSLLSISLEMLSVHYASLYHESLNSYISFGEVDQYDSQTTLHPDEWGYKQNKNTSKKLPISLKTNKQ